MCIIKKIRGKRKKVSSKSISKSVIWQLSEKFALYGFVFFTIFIVSCENSNKNELYDSELIKKEFLCPTSVESVRGNKMGGV